MAHATAGLEVGPRWTAGRQWLSCCRRGGLDVPREVQQRRRKKQGDCEGECACVRSKRSVVGARRRVGLKETAVCVMATTSYRT